VSVAQSRKLIRFPQLTRPVSLVETYLSATARVRAGALLVRIKPAEIKYIQREHRLKRVAPRFGIGILTQ